MLKLELVLMPSVAGLASQRSITQPGYNAMCCTRVLTQSQNCITPFTRVITNMWECPEIQGFPKIAEKKLVQEQM